MRHFITLHDLTKKDILQLLERAIALKRLTKNGQTYTPLCQQTLVLIFEKSSTRTRVSFESAMNQMGGGTIFLSPADSHLNRGEPIEDTAKVISSMAQAVVIRAISHTMVERFANSASIPVINGLTDKFHPCQLLADLQTIFEHFGYLEKLTLTWVGDGNNVCHSWINAATIIGFRLRVCTPPNYGPYQDVLAQASSNIQIVDDASQAVQNADAVLTDTWSSMGHEDETDERVKSFSDYQVDQALMDKAAKNAVFLHCLPAYRGLEVAADVIDGKQSLIWQQCENRLHAQKALLELLLAI